MTLRDLMPWDKSFDLPVLRRVHLGQSINSLQNQMNHLFDDMMDGLNVPALAGKITFPAVDIIENDQGFTVKAELAGMNPDDVEIGTAGSFLTITGKKESHSEDEKENYLRREATYGSFERTIALPSTADCDRTEAAFQNGVLKITVPKKAEALQTPKKVQIKKAA